MSKVEMSNRNNNDLTLVSLSPQAWDDFFYELNSSDKTT